MQRRFLFNLRTIALLFSERERTICYRPSVCLSVGQIFRIGTVRYAEGLWRMRRHGPVTYSEDFPSFVCLSAMFVHPTQAIKIFGNVSMPLVPWSSVTFR